MHEWSKEKYKMLVPPTMPTHGVREGDLEEIVINGQQFLHHQSQIWNNNNLIKNNNHIIKQTETQAKFLCLVFFAWVKKASGSETWWGHCVNKTVLVCIAAISYTINFDAKTTHVHVALPLVLITGVDHFRTAPFSALEQTPYALVAYDSEWVTVAFYNAFWNINQSCIYVIWLIHGWWNCYCLGAHCVYTMQLCTTVYSVTPCKATYIGYTCV